MQAMDDRNTWNTYRDAELARLAPLLAKLGYHLDDAQVHIDGERYLMAGARDVGGGGKKLVLTAKETGSDTRVLIKFSTDEAGRREIERERHARTIINKLDFAYHAFLTPRELFVLDRQDYTLSITEYIEQERPLLSRPLEEQFFIALHAFETQEGVHATTNVHAHAIKKAFGSVGTHEYLEEFERFCARTRENDPNNIELRHALERATAFLREHKTSIDRFSGFLTHADFVPNNLRIRGRDLYLLDYASIHFGNKYESWARFINFMTHHNRSLELALANYVRHNRGEEEYLNLRLMRAYKLGYLLMYHTSALERAEGALRELVRARITLWTHVLISVLDDTPPSEAVVNEYLKKLHSLRSDEEKARQREMIGRG